MLRRILDRLEFTKGLGFRLGGLLSVAILPIGLISVIQTLHLSREYQRSSEIALLGRTATAAAGERALLQSALGTADALGPAVLETMDRPQACSDIMRGLVQRTVNFVYAGFTRLDGVTECSSVRGVHDLSGESAFRQFSESPGTLVTTSEDGPVTGKSVVVVIQPLYRGVELLGFIAVSMSHDLLRSTHVSGLGTEGARILTFNNQGEVISSDREGAGDIAEVLPRGKSLPSLLSRSETTFRDISNSGERRVFSVVPVVPGLVYALGSWNRAESGITGIDITRRTALILPLILWAASLAVAYFAVYRLVLRHIRELRSQMRRFAIGDRSAPPPVLADAPAEIEDMSQTFHNMARILIRDEEAMEAAVNEKTVLLKEVHHRVKNNLQLIASIINMQIRVIEHDDARRVLRSVQDRVASLATIYRNLYQAEHLDSVQADRLIRDIISQMTNASVGPGTGLRIDTRLEPLVLMPDQAVPLSLLATEAFTNALKYSGVSNPEAEPWVRVSLRADGPGHAVLEVENSIGASSLAEGTGLGSQLIEAFATQLEGEAEQETGDGRFLLRLRFRVENLHKRDGAEMPQVVLTSAARPGSRH
ncbi:histidine kinase dimerization/phosphoacceptor domain -containing protein [Paracoccus pantotrophus]|uniref:histidine kinase dimerization/phosphoacceptor domain -containing protein n=1 Tax=Paracoccus pantotrophus TaxID=82367 RepID=UPI0008E96B1E|nr:histidine kinase dimerization/phosphoacceptor domain -containing protein [Paracoccus pantotrophus]MDF3854436.1 histidine kinase dimerization/phosphoacceptor domain -containing protein [Paracoccus pantotrophus]SFO38404.1 Two-component sensor histidine kinase, contains HisKA and HATPase domains [Paracoccus pantotrophus]